MTHKESTDDRNSQINTIALWMGWHKQDSPSFLLVDPNIPIFSNWVDDLKIVKAGEDFDPFSNISECAEVMEEVIERGAWWSLHSPAENIRYCCFMGGKSIVDQAEGDSWPEAFCNVLIKLIEQGKKDRATKDKV
jgi:hypothetical protein